MAFGDPLRNVKYHLCNFNLLEREDGEHLRLSGHMRWPSPSGLGSCKNSWCRLVGSLEDSRRWLKIADRMEAEKNMGGERVAATGAGVVVLPEGAGFFGHRGEVGFRLGDQAVALLVACQEIETQVEARQEI